MNAFSMGNELSVPLISTPMLKQLTLNFFDVKFLNKIY